MLAAALTILELVLIYEAVLADTSDNQRIFGVFLVSQYSASPPCSTRSNWFSTSRNTLPVRVRPTFGRFHAAKQS